MPTHGKELWAGWAAIRDVRPCPCGVLIVPPLAQMGLAAEIEMAVPACPRPLRPLVLRRGKAPARVWGISLASHPDGRATGNILVVHGRDTCSRHMDSHGEHDPPTRALSRLRWGLHLSGGLASGSTAGVQAWALYRLPAR